MMVASPPVAAEEITYRTDPRPGEVELGEFYRRQGHATTVDGAKLERMMSNSFVVVTAYRQGELIGLARGITDGATGRLVECKLDARYQGPACVTKRDGRIEHDAAGIAGEMARRVIESLVAYGVERIDAIAYGTEVDFCLDMGFRKMPGVVALELCPKTRSMSAAPTM